MRTFIVIACLAAGSLALPGAGTAAAQETGSGTEAGPRGPIRKWLGVELLTSSIDAAAAGEEGTGERGWGFQLNLGLTAFDVVTVSTDLGIVGLRDKREFTQSTTRGDRTSGVAAGLASLVVGLRTPPLALGGKNPPTVSVGAGVGHTLTSASRSIAECIDCHQEDVKLRAGGFREAGIHFTTGRRWGVSARYRTYGGRSDFQDAVMIGGTFGS